MKEILIYAIRDAYYKKQYNELKEANSQNPSDADICKKLGDCYYQGNGVLKNQNEAVRCYKNAVHYGSIEALSFLSFCYYMGTGISKDLKKSFKYAESASRNGDIKGKYLLGYLYVKGEGVESDLDKAFDLFQECIEAENYLGYYGLGLYYEKMDDKPTAIVNYKYSLGVYPDAIKDIERLDPDFIGSDNLDNATLFIIGDKCLRDGCIEKALEYLEKSAQKGYAKANVSLGNYYFEKEDFKKGIEYLENAVDDDDDAMLSLALCYQMGVGVKSDPAIAEKLLKRSSDKGNIYAKWFLDKDSRPKFSFDDALFDIGWCLEKGIGVKKDYQAAEKKYREAYNIGNMDAEVRLQEMGAIGRYHKYSDKEYDDIALHVAVGNKDAMTKFALYYVHNKDYKKAHELLDKAIALGSIKAIHNKGVLFSDGIGLEKRDRKRAFELFKLAADQGCPESYYELACFYNNGEVVEKDLEMAKELAKKAVDLGCEDAKKMLNVLDWQIKIESFAKNIKDPKIQKILEESANIKPTYPEEIIEKRVELMAKHFKISKEEARNRLMEIAQLIKSKYGSY